MTVATISETSSTPPGLAEAERPRVIGRYRSHEPGPTLICTASIHGNEPAGHAGLQRFFAQLADNGGITRGELVGFLGNRKALAQGQRFIDVDLNRAWLPDRLEAVRNQQWTCAEDEEMAALDREFTAAIARARGPVYLLDLHTTSGPGPAFVVLDDAIANREFGRVLPGPLVLGLEEEIGGTLLNYAAMRGITAVSFECGSHHDPDSVEQAQEAIWIALGRAGMLDDAAVLGQFWDRRARRAGLPEVVEVIHRHDIAEGCPFEMLPGHESFESVAKGDVIATECGRPIEVPLTGRLLMPLYQEQGDDGFFVVRDVAPMWLEVSSVVRRWPTPKALSHLPGVSLHPELPDSLVVDRSIARFVTLPLFHLLGYRRSGERDARFWTLTRR